MSTRDWIYIVALGAAFGAVFLINEILLRQLGPLGISFGRVALGAVAVWVLVVVLQRPVQMSGMHVVHSAVFGIFMFALPFALFPLGQKWITGGMAGIINAMTPLAVVVVSQFWPGGERATLLKFIGVLSGLAGIVILSLPGLSAPESNQTIGILLVLIAPVSYAVALNYIRKLSEVDIFALIAVAMTSAAVLLLPLVLLVEGLPPALTKDSWISLALIGPVFTGWFFLAALVIMRRVGATASSTLTFIAPISALLLGAWILGEEVGVVHILGMLAIFVGLVFIDGRLIRRVFGTANSQPDG